MTDTTGGPAFVLVGVNKPDGTVRLYASRDIPGAQMQWGVVHDRYGTATGWHIDAEMRLVLVTDGATWGEAFARVTEIWNNHDREQREAVEHQAARKRPAISQATARALAESGTETLEDPPGMQVLIPGFIEGKVVHVAIERSPDALANRRAVEAAFDRHAAREEKADGAADEG